MVRYKRQTTIHSNQKRFCSSCDSRRNESRSYGKSYRKELGVYMSYNSSSPRWAVSLFMYYPTPLTCWKEKKKKLGMRAAKCSVCVVVFLLVFASVPTSKVHLRFIFFSVCFAWLLVPWFLFRVAVLRLLTLSPLELLGCDRCLACSSISPSWCFPFSVLPLVGCSIFLFAVKHNIIQNRRLGRLYLMSVTYQKKLHRRYYYNLFSHKKTKIQDAHVENTEGSVDTPYIYRKLTRMRSLQLQSIVFRLWLID